MPLQVGPLLSGEEDPTKPKNQQQGLVGQGNSQLPGVAIEGTNGLDFSSLFPNMERTPIQAAAPIRDTSGLMFNPEFAQRDLGIQRQMADLGLYRDQGKQGVNQEYERNVQKAGTMQQQARKRLMERMSGQD